MFNKEKLIYAIAVTVAIVGFLGAIAFPIVLTAAGIKYLIGGQYGEIY